MELKYPFLNPIQLHLVWNGAAPQEKSLPWVWGGTAPFYED